MKTIDTSKQQRGNKRVVTFFSSLMRRRALLLTLAAFVCCAGVVMASRAFTAKTAEAGTSPSNVEALPSKSNSATAQIARSKDHVHRSALWSQLQEAFRLLGDRLEKPGKERLTFAGTLEKSMDSQPESFPFRLVWELPGRLRLEEFRGQQPQVTTFDGATLAKLGGRLSQQDQEQIETLLYDSAEHFFIGRAQGQAMRYLGEGFSESPDDETAPHHELYEVVDRIGTTAEGRQQIKHYYFNSGTRLLDKVRYTLERNGATIAVEVQLTDWRPYQDQQFPGHIVRLENGEPVFSLKITSVGISPKTEDGAFAAR
jgi:hypothetical protein